MTFICGQKVNFILYVLFDMFQGYCKLAFFGIWACQATYAQRDTINFRKTFVFIGRQKINFTRHVFLAMLQRCANLFWVLWECLVIYTPNDCINLWKTSMFICIPKINFIINFLRFKKSCNLIGSQHFSP